MWACSWLEAFLAPLTTTGVDRMYRRVNVFRLAGTIGWGLLAESNAVVHGRPGVWRSRSSAWVLRPSVPRAYLLEVALHSWDAATEAAATGDGRWLEVPRRQMYAERDRRTAILGVELDTLNLVPVAVGIVPAMLAGLSADDVRTLAARHAPVRLSSD